jgi:hypothetical protein
LGIDEMVGNFYALGASDLYSAPVVVLINNLVWHKLKYLNVNAPIAYCLVQSLHKKGSFIAVKLYAFALLLKK